jgi:hypothetical protein
MFKVSCPNCHFEYGIPAEKAGKTLEITCRNNPCTQVFRVTLPSAEAPLVAKIVQEAANQTARLLLLPNPTLRIEAQEFLLKTGRNLIGRYDAGIQIQASGNKLYIQQKGKPALETDAYHRIHTADQADGQYRSGLSRIHCCIETRQRKNGTTEYLLYDCGALIPVQLNEETPLDPLDQVYLQHNDLLKLGALQLRFILELPDDPTPDIYKR